MQAGDTATVLSLSLFMDCHEVPFHTLLIESLKLFFLSRQALLRLTAALADAEFYAFWKMSMLELY